MNIVKNLLEVIDEVLDEKEKEVILSFLDNADEIDFSDFWRTKNYDVVANKGLTTYWTQPVKVIEDTFGIGGPWASKKWKWKTLEPGFRPVSAKLVYERLLSAFKKLEKSPKLRAVNAFSC